MQRASVVRTKISKDLFTTGGILHFRRASRRGQVEHDETQDNKPTHVTVDTLGIIVGCDRLHTFTLQET